MDRLTVLNDALAHLGEPAELDDELGAASGNGARKLFRHLDAARDRVLSA